MMEQNPVEVAVNNDRSLMALKRAIEFSQGQFSLVFVRCNYTTLRSRILQRLREIYSGEIRELVLPQHVQTLYTTIQANLGDEKPSALMILGLESVDALDRLLTSTNQIRDEFRKQLPFPLVLWVNDEVLRKLVRLGPDFSSWAATPIKFAIATDKLLDCLSAKADSVFAIFLEDSVNKLPNNRAIEVLQGRHRLEMESALQDLQNRHVRLEAKLDASLQFIQGQDDYAHDRIDSAITRYRDSLRYWRNSDNLERQGVLLLHLGLCYCRNADRYPSDARRQLEEAWTYLQQCVEVFEVAERPFQVARYISQLAEVLQRLEAWQALEVLVRKSLPLHQTYGSQFQLAIDYGFLAKIALLESRWENANKDAAKAIAVLTEALENQPGHNGLYRSLLQLLYRLVLVKSQQELGQIQEASNNLELAIRELEPVIKDSVHQLDPHRYLRTLRQLRSLYFDLGCYREAFRIKQEQRSVEQKYGFRAFIGAGQLQPELKAVNPAMATVDPQGNVAQAIAASGRQQDINRLVERISRPDYKLTVIHGKSGVGKSSIVSAGLVPALKSAPINDQIALPVVVRVYTDWVGALGRDLARGLESLNLPTFAPFTIQAIVEQLRKNEERHLLTILIFDQLEEFFLDCPQLEQRREFYDFFQQCLNFPSVQILLSIRNDDIESLLEFEKYVDLERFNTGILDKTIRYRLDNFSPKDAREVIESLTKRANFQLENALVNELVSDLTAEGEVRPIELQVVGAELQAENITTLEKYRQVGPKQRLVEQFLEKVIEDCGKDNEDAARLVLYSLTDENGNRPIKTKSELIIDLVEEAEKLDLILEILLGSGLIFLVPEVPENRYQLIHDYLVAFIRQKEQFGIKEELVALRSKDELNQNEIEQLREQKALLAELADTRYQIVQDYIESLVPYQEESGLLAELAKARKRNEVSQFIIEQLREDKDLLSELADAKEKQNRSEQRRKKAVTAAIAGSVTAMLALTFLSFVAVTQRRQAQISEINAISASSQARFASHNEIEALKESLKARKELKQVDWMGADTETQQQVETAMQQVVYGIRERNRLEGHTAAIRSITFSPDGKILASASDDNTVKLWRPDGSEIPTIQKHGDKVSSVAFSPNGQIIASASWDKSVKLWRQDGTLIQTIDGLKGHKDRVLSVSFSPDGQRFATASADKTVKLWQRDGTLLNTFVGHSDGVISVSFSPDGETIASASADKTVKLWRRDGTLLRTLRGHSDQVISVSFSPDGKTIASASDDNTVKLWRRDGTFLMTLNDHRDSVYSVAFSPDSKTIATASRDKTIKLWQRDGTLIDTLEGHSNWVTSVSFSPDGRTLASASRDNTIRLWSLDKKFPITLQGSNSPVNAVSFSPNGQILASASNDDDKTVRLWRKDGILLKTLQGHANGVLGVRFSPDGQTIASASTDRTVKLWRLNGTLLRTLEGHTKGVLSVSFSPDGQAIASASRDNTVKIWRFDGTLLHTLQGHSEPVNWVSFSPDGQTIASASEDKTVKLWSRDGTLLQTLQGHNSGVWGVSFSFDGQTLASASSDSTVKLWDTKNGTLLRTLSGHSGGVTSVSFNPQRDIIASVSEDRTIKLWERDGTLIKTIKTDESFTSVSFSPDGKTIASASTDGRVILWNLADLNLENLSVRGCNWLHDYLKTNRNVTPSDRHLCDDVGTQR